MDITQFLLTYLDKYHKIQCSNTKNDKYTFKVAEKALEYNYIRFGNSWFIPAVSIDIDFKSDFNHVIKDNNLPEPTLIVHTDRGTHIHWFLTAPIKTANTFQIKYLNILINHLQGLFGGDKYATTGNSGRIWRNPVKHSHIFSGKLISFSDFILPEKLVVLGKETPKTGRGKYLKILRTNFKDVVEGGRHSTLFEYGSALAYTTGITNPLVELEHKNDQMPMPLPLTEVLSIANSIERFMTTKYKKGNYTSSQKTIDFNRRIAQKQADKKLLEIVRKLAISIAPIFLANSLTARKAAVSLAISKNTWTKYAKIVVNTLKESLITTKEVRFKASKYTNTILSNQLYKFNKKISIKSWSIFPHNTT